MSGETITGSSSSSNSRKQKGTRKTAANEIAVTDGLEQAATEDSNSLPPPPQDLEHLPELGLVCITFSDAVRYRALTRKRLLQFETDEQLEMLGDLYRDNLARFELAIDFCLANNIKLYRLTSAFFPFADTSVGKGVLEAMAEDVGRVGRRATQTGLRVVLHPDQFCVLSSDSSAVIENSILILSTHAWIFDLLEQPRSSWAAMNIHGGKSDRSDRLVSVVRDLPEAIRSRITFENDEHAYHAHQILDVCQRAEVPFVFDAHHHVCAEKISSYEHQSVPELLAAAGETWKENAHWQLTHISNGREYFNDPKHSDVIVDMPRSFASPGLWVEVEAKHKEVAIEKMRREWREVVGAESGLRAIAEAAQA